MGRVAAKDYATFWSRLDLAKTGRTTRQMQKASPDALYLCPDNVWPYTAGRELARSLGRADLVLVGPGWLDSWAVATHPFCTICVDHAFTLTLINKDKFWLAVRRAIENSDRSGARIRQG